MECDALKYMNFVTNDPEIAHDRGILSALIQGVVFSIPHERGCVSVPHGRGPT
jgi:hypothetical protein